MLKKPHLHFLLNGVTVRKATTYNVLMQYLCHTSILQVHVCKPQSTLMAVYLPQNLPALQSLTTAPLTQIGLHISKCYNKATSL